MHICKNVNVGSRRTSIRLEEEMWAAVNELCQREGMTVHELCSLIDKFRGENNSLTAALRVFLVLYYRVAATEAGHVSAGHGAGANGHGADHWRPIIAQVFQS